MENALNDNNQSILGFLNHFYKNNLLHLSKQREGNICISIMFKEIMAAKHEGIDPVKLKTTYFESMHQAGFTVNAQTFNAAKIFTPNDSLYKEVEALLFKDNTVHNQAQLPSTSGVNNNLTITLNKSTPYTCEICKQSFPTHHGLNTHRGIKHTQSSKILKKCNYCDKAFTQPSSLSRHITEIHKKINNPS